MVTTVPSDMGPRFPQSAVRGLARPAAFNLIALVLVLAPSGTTRAEPSRDRGLHTGSSHLVVAASSPSEGLEVGIPRSSWYARGVALDIQGRWDESYNAYREALREFVEQLRARPAWSRMIRGWILKAEYLKDQSERLRYPLYRFGPPSAALLYQRGLAKHNKWLAIRAFTGRSEEGLVREVIDDYQRTLLQSPGYDSARLALASLYHEIGQHSRGRQEFARVQDVSRSWMAVEVAYYYTTAGEVERALESLDRAVQYNEGNKRHALRSNNFDRLRSLPRFRAVVGEP